MHWAHSVHLVQTRRCVKVHLPGRFGSDVAMEFNLAARNDGKGSLFARERSQRIMVDIPPGSPRVLEIVAPRRILSIIMAVRLTLPIARARRLRGAAYRSVLLALPRSGTWELLRRPNHRSPSKSAMPIAKTMRALAIVNQAMAMTGTSFPCWRVTGIMVVRCFGSRDRHV